MTKRSNLSMKERWSRACAGRTSTLRRTQKALDTGELAPVKIDEDRLYVHEHKRLWGRTALQAAQQGRAARIKRRQPWSRPRRNHPRGGGALPDSRVRS